MLLFASDFYPSPLASDERDLCDPIFRDDKRAKNRSFQSSPLHHRENFVFLSASPSHLREKKAESPSRYFAHPSILLGDTCFSQICDSL